MDSVSRRVSVEADDLTALNGELQPLLKHAPAKLLDVASALGKPGNDVAALGPLIEAIYAWGDGPEAAAALDAVRRVLRRDIDRRMEIAR